jgi:cation diffusion facilitator CzcD-associated flavoprotein CzcO
MAPAFAGMGEFEGATMPDHDGAARETLRLIGPDPANWVPDRPGVDHNVLIVGGGQSGCALAYALRRAGIGKVSVIDQAADEGAAGIWTNTARMNVLRTAKNLPGPEMGITGLGFQAWYEARHGEAAYDRIGRIPRLDWAEYLAWFRHFLGIAVRYGTRLDRIEPAEGASGCICRAGQGRKPRRRGRSFWRTGSAAMADRTCPRC